MTILAKLNLTLSLSKGRHGLCAASRADGRRKHNIHPSYFVAVRFDGSADDLSVDLFSR